MENNRVTIAVGSFEVVDEMIVVGDPCYRNNSSSVGKFIAKNGRYNVYVIMSDEGGWGVRVAKLIAIHEDDDHVGNNKEWVCYDFFLGVDSGTFGIFDNEYHYDNHYDDQLDREWYERCVIEGLTKETQYAVYDDSCVISESGYGDGVYFADIMFDNDNDTTICGVAVTFINEDEDED